MGPQLRRASQTGSQRGFHRFSSFYTDVKHTTNNPSNTPTCFCYYLLDTLHKNTIKSARCNRLLLGVHPRSLVVFVRTTFFSEQNPHDLQRKTHGMFFTLSFSRSDSQQGNQPKQLPVKPNANRPYPWTLVKPQHLPLIDCLVFDHRAELTVQFNVRSGVGVLSLNVSWNTAEQNLSWDSCSLVDAIPSLHATKSTTIPTIGEEKCNNQAGVGVVSKKAKGTLPQRKPNAAHPWADKTCRR